MPSLFKIAFANFNPYWQLLRCVLTLAVLLLAALSLSDTRGYGVVPHLRIVSAGLCSGDCLTCRCAPEMAASGNCCCSLSRLPRELAKNDPTFGAAVGSGMRAHKEVNRYFRQPACGRLAAAEQVEKLLSMPPPCLDGSFLPPLVTPPVRIWGSPPDRVSQSLAMPPDPPPPEGRV